MDMECEPLSSSSTVDHHHHQRDDVATTGVSREDVVDDLPFEAITRIRLRDVIPCNLRSTHDFLQSSVTLAVETSYLETFAKCYGYLMYDRSKKLSHIQSGDATTRARVVVQWLSEIQDIDTFRRTLYDHLIQTRSLLRDDMMDALDLDDDINEALKNRGDGSGDDDGCNDDSKRKTDERSSTSSTDDAKISGRDLLRIARDSLDQILAFLRSEDHLRRAINVNGFFREIFVTDSSQARARVENVWNGVATATTTSSFDANAILSIVLQDAILSTGLETHSLLLFLVRVSLLFTFLVSQTFGRKDRDDGGNDDGDDDPVNVARVFSETPKNETTDVVFDYFSTFDSMTMDKFIGTVFVRIVRSAFVNFVEWPCRLVENNGRTIDLNAIHGALTRNLLFEKSSDVFSTESVRWLRAFGPRRLFGKSEKEVRLYVNATSVIGMFEQMSRGIATEDVSAAGRWDAATAMFGTDGNNDETTKRLRIQAYSIELKRLYTDYQRSARLCARTIVDNLRTANGQDARDYARSSSYATSPNTSSSTEQDIDTFVEEIGRSLTFAVLSLIRHDVKSFGSRFDSIYYETLGGEDSEQSARERREKHMLRYDENVDSYSILLQQAYAHLYRVKISVGQIESFIAYMVDLWNEQIGIVNFEQLGALLLSLYRTFPIFRSTTTGDIAAE